MKESYTGEGTITVSVDQNLDQTWRLTSKRQDHFVFKERYRGKSIGIRRRKVAFFGTV